MKLLWQKFRDLPPKKQIWFWLALVILLIPLHLRAHGYSLTPPEERFRRQEEANFLGPMEILGSYETDTPLFHNAIVAADEHTAAIFLYSGSDDILRSREREGDFTLMAGGYLSSVSWYTQEEESLTLPLILFDRHPKAVRAELDIDTGQMHWTLGSIRDASGWFRFDLIRAEEPSQEESRAIAALYELLCSGEEAEIIFTVRFYGAAGDLIAEETQE